MQIFPFYEKTFHTKMPRRSTTDGAGNEKQQGVSFLIQTDMNHHCLMKHIQ